MESGLMKQGIGQNTHNKYWIIAHFDSIKQAVEDCSIVIGTSGKEGNRG